MRQAQNGFEMSTPRRWALVYGVSLARWMRVALTLLLCAHATQARTQDAVAIERDGTRYAITHESVTVGVDCATGAVHSLRSSAASKEWLTEPVIPFALALSAAESRWDAGRRRLVRVEGLRLASCGVGRSADGDDAALAVVFNAVKAGGKWRPIDGSFTLTTTADDAQIRWQIALHNGGDDVIASVFFPFLDGLRIAGRNELIRPYMAGIRTPVDVAMAPVADHYPHPLSMSFIVLQGPEAGLYLASHEPEPVTSKLHFRNTDAHPSGLSARHGWAIALERFPFLEPGAVWSDRAAVLMPHADDWHVAARAYRSFFQRHFAPITMSPLLRRLSQIASYHFKTPWNHDYQPALGFARVLDFERSQAYQDHGIRALRLDGWHRGGYDAFLPDYTPLQALGGEAAFTAAIARAKREDLRIYPYLNVRLLRRDDERHQRLREHCAVRRADGSLHTETYRHAGYGDATGVVMCPRCRAWAAHIEARARHLIDEVRVPGLYLDQFGLGAHNGLLCFNSDHDHPTPANIWGPSSVALAKRLHEAGRARDPNFLLMIEGNFDRLYPYVDLPFSWSDESRQRPDDNSRAALEVFRYVFDDLATQKMYSHGWSDGVAEALAIGNVIDSGGHPVRRIQDRIPDVFHDGRYIDDRGIRVTPTGAARASTIRGEDRFAVAVRSGVGEASAVSQVSLALDLDAMGVEHPPGDARVLYSPAPERHGQPLSMTRTNAIVEVQLPVTAIPALLLFD